MPAMFTADDLDTMQLLRCAFDPAGLCNPGKIFPTPRLCGEVPGVRREPHPLVTSGKITFSEVKIFNLKSRSSIGRKFCAGLLPMPAADSIPGQLAEACDEVRLAGPADAVAGVQPRLVAVPASTGQASAVLKAAAELGLAVIPRGTGSRLTGAVHQNARTW